MTGGDTCPPRPASRPASDPFSAPVRLTHGHWTSVHLSPQGPELCGDPRKATVFTFFFGN